jgi:hypothetical protein
MQDPAEPLSTAVGDVAFGYAISSNCVVSIKLCGFHQTVWFPSNCVVSIKLCGFHQTVWFRLCRWFGIGVQRVVREIFIFGYDLCLSCRCGAAFRHDYGVSTGAAYNCSSHVLRKFEK